MEPFEIIISIGILCIIACLGFISWLLYGSTVKPRAETERQQKRIIEVEVEKAKIELNSHTIQTRMEPKTKESDVDNDLEKLKQLRRKK